MFSQYIFKYQPSQQPNQGFSIVEAMVSLICVTVTLFLAASLFTNQRQQNITNNQRAQAGAIAQYYFENYRNQITTAASLPALSEVMYVQIRALQMVTRPMG
jgi:type II secretory pathway pseudopilin PulG